MLKIISDTNIKRIYRKPEKSISDLFPNKSILEKIFSFISPKQKFILLCNSKKLLKEYDSKIDDFFMPRKYQEKIKNYTKNYEDLFYQILNDIKKEKEISGEKLCLYEIENDMVKYLKYLTIKYDKNIKLSLININSMEIWKLEFISKVLETLEKNVQLKIKLIYLDLKTHEIFDYICRFTKCINTLEIVDIYMNKNQYNNFTEDIVSLFNWSTITKICINMNDFSEKKNNDIDKTEKFLIRFINAIESNNLTDLDLKCNFINFNNIEKFVVKNSKNIKKLNVENYKLNDDIEIDNNSILKKFVNVNDLSLSIDESKLDKLLYYFYPIFPQIKKFHLIINEDENQYDNEIEKENEKKNEKKYLRNNKNKYKKRNKTKNNIFEKLKEDGQYKICLNQLNYYSEIPNIEFEPEEFSEEESDFEETRNINIKKFSFTTEKKEQRKKCKKQNDGEISCGKINNNIFVSSLSNLKSCESLTYEIKKENIYSNMNNKINSLFYLINVLDINKNNLKYLEIYINNDENSSIDIDDFILLLQKISACKHLNIFIFECELYDEYALLFNDYFNIGQSLTHLSLIHSTDLDIMKIINEHENLTHLRFELLSNNSKESKEISKNYKFDLDLNREWKSIDLTNYPINQNLINIIKNNKNIFASLYICNNISDTNEQTINEILKNVSENNENKW